MKGMVLLEFSGKRALVVGASETGIRRAKLLRKYGAEVTLIDSSLDLKLKDMEFRRTAFESGMIEDYDIVVAATDDRDLNKKIVKLANKENKLSSSSERGDTSLSFPAVFDDENLTAGFYTKGKAPFYAKTLKEMFSHKWDKKSRRRLELLAEVRERIIGENRGRDFFSRALEMSQKELERFLSKNIRIGTRGSKLALTQAETVKRLLEEKYPDYTFEIAVIKTRGDRDQTTSLTAFGDEKNIFTSEIEEHLLRGDIDFAVHSLKDLATVLDPRFEISSLPPVREETGDVLITRKDEKKISRIATGSPRRKFEIEKLFPDAEVVDIRGNIDTRINKLKSGYCDAVVLAKAGINRLKIEDDDLSIEEIDILPALRQGILGLEFTKDNGVIREMLERIGDSRTGEELAFESKILEILGGDCQIILGGRFERDSSGERFRLLYSPDGKNAVIDSTEYVEDIERRTDLAGELAERVKLRAEEKKWSI